MTAKRAERLTGYEIRKMAEKTGKVTYGAFQDDELVASGTHRIDELALRVLVKEIYKLHAVNVLKQHNWRCARCGGPWRLQIHHRQYRSHGGTHRVENLEPVCSDCHKIIHKLERSK
jgi:hypothetical protein